MLAWPEGLAELLPVQLIFASLALLAVLHVVEGLLKKPAAVPTRAAADYTSGWPAYGGGGLPREEKPSTPCGSWWDLPEGTFKLRSATYLTDKVKQPATQSVFEVVSVTMIDCDEALFDVGRRLLPLRDWLNARPKEQFLVTNRACPVGGGRCRNVITVARRREPRGTDAAFDRAWDRYVEGDGAYRDLRLKYLPQLSNMPPAVARTIALLGGQRPVILGKGYLGQQHYSGANYVAVTTDIRTSRAARSITGNILAFSTAAMVDEAFIAEAKRADELPERLLYQIQFRQVDTAGAARPLRPEDYVTPTRPGAAAAPPAGWSHCADGGYVRNQAHA